MICQIKMLEQTDICILHIEISNIDDAVNLLQMNASYLELLVPYQHCYIEF